MNAAWHGSDGVALVLPGRAWLRPASVSGSNTRRVEEVTHDHDATWIWNLWGKYWWRYRDRKLCLSLRRRWPSWGPLNPAERHWLHQASWGKNVDVRKVDGANYESMIIGWDAKGPKEKWVRLARLVKEEL